MDLYHRQILEYFRYDVQLTLSNEEDLSQDIILIDKLKAKSGLEDIEFLIFSNKDIYTTALKNRDRIVTPTRGEVKVIWRMHPILPNGTLMR